MQRAALAQGKPRNAIVRCWVDLEDVTERAGMDRDWSETSSEFTARVLGVLGMEKDSVDRLAALYREARFSAHPVTEQMRDEAVAAIDEITTSWPSVRAPRYPGISHDAGQDEAAMESDRATTVACGDGWRVRGRPALVRRLAPQV